MFWNNMNAVCKQDAGKYMVKAVNDAGETQSIADFIILEPTPERVTDIVKTVTVEHVDGQRVRIPSNILNICNFIFHSYFKRAFQTHLCVDRLCILFLLQSIFISLTKYTILRYKNQKNKKKTHQIY